MARRSGPSRRSMLKAGARGAVGFALAPMVSLGRARPFAGSQRTYSTRAIDLMHRALVIDMLSPFKLGASTWLTRPDTFTPAEVQRFKDSSINVFHIGVGFGGQNQ